jgi:cobalamin biosynthesis protein CobD/CbiB
MAAMAGLLGVSLEKPGQYRLGAHGAAADADSIHAASRIVTLCACLGALAVAFVIGARHAHG